MESQPRAMQTYLVGLGDCGNSTACKPPTSVSPSYLKRNPHLAEAMQQCVPLVSSLRELLRKREDIGAIGPHLSYELEARFGQLSPAGQFEAGTTKQKWDSILSEAERYGAWDRVEDWTEDECYFYTVKVGAMEKTVRTQVVFMADGGGKSADSRKPHRTHIHKQKIGSRTFRCVSKPPVIRSDDIQCGPIDPVAAANAQGIPSAMRVGQDIRVSLSAEETVSESILPPLTNPFRVAIRQRKRFFFCEEMWSLDLTLVWAAATQLDAEEKQTFQPPEYHVEFECVNPAAYLRCRDDEYVAASLVLKMADWIDRDRNGFYLRPVPQTGL